jgi:putative pyruvate formate lyase activating enzyme
MQPEDLAMIFLELQAGGCHNINLVSPTHIVPQILAAILIAIQAGMHIPIVYNTGGYDSLTTLQLLDGVVDIYMPDMKYANPQVGLHYSKIRNYPSINQTGVREMYRQVGDLKLDTHGLAIRGLLVRHLVLPNKLAGTQEIVRFLAEEISPNTYLNLMDQYHPEYLARQYPRINRRISQEEWSEVLSLAHQYGLHRLDHDD